jgi:site-specific recombinase XerC
MDDFRTLVQVQPEKATQDNLIAYSKALNGQASATVHKKIAALRSLYAYLNRRGIRTDNPAMIVDMPKVDRLRSVSFLNREQVWELMQVFDDSLLGIRDRAIVSVLLHGLRLAEAVGLNVEDYREGNLRVIGKGNKMRIVPLDLTTQRNLEEYLKRRKTGPMFLSRLRNGDRIERRTMQDVVYKATARIGKRMHPHALRHTAGTIMVKHEGLAKAQRRLGHASPATTMIYAHLDVDDLRENIEDLHLLGTPPGPPVLRVVEEVA